MCTGDCGGGGRSASLWVPGFARLPGCWLQHKVFGHHPERPRWVIAICSQWFFVHDDFFVHLVIMMKREQPETKSWNSDIQTAKLNFENVNACIQSVMSRLISASYYQGQVKYCSNVRLFKLVPLSVPDHPLTLKRIFAVLRLSNSRVNKLPTLQRRINMTFDKVQCVGSTKQCVSIPDTCEAQQSQRRGWKLVCRLQRNC